MWYLPGPAALIIARYGDALKWLWIAICVLKILSAGPAICLRVVTAARTGAESQLAGCYMIQWRYRAETLPTPRGHGASQSGHSIQVTWPLLANQRAGSGGHWPIRGQQVSWTDHPSVSGQLEWNFDKISKLILTCRLSTEITSSTLETIWLKDAMPQDLQSEGTQLSITSAHCCIPPLCHCLAAPMYTAHLCHLRNHRVHVTSCHNTGWCHDY